MKIEITKKEIHCSKCGHIAELKIEYMKNKNTFIYNIVCGECKTNSYHDLNSYKKDRNNFKNLSRRLKYRNNLNFNSHEKERNKIYKQIQKLNKMKQDTIKIDEENKKEKIKNSYIKDIHTFVIDGKEYNINYYEYTKENNYFKRRICLGSGDKIFFVE